MTHARPRESLQRQLRRVLPKLSRADLSKRDAPEERESKLGDISIALESGPEETVLTTDRSFQVLAPALGLTVERFDPTHPP